LAVALSITICLIVGIGIMFQTQYFWGKESNPNINAINTSITNFNNVFNIVPVIVIIAVGLGAVMLLSTARGFG